MKKVLVLGSGRVAGPLVKYLLDRSDISVTLAGNDPQRIGQLVGNNPRGTGLEVDAQDLPRIGRLIAGHDVAVSLLPPAYHHLIAELCIEHGTQMVTTSYVSPEMKLLDEMARRAGVTVLCESGLDPGLDHMSAMRMIDDARQRNHRIISFKSYCGGLPAPDANDNPFGYKFSWNPRGVLAAGKNSARWREDGHEKVVPGPRLFDHYRVLHFDGLGDFEAYPNRDSLGYIDRYGLQNVETLHRGTLRYPGWCDTWRKIIELGLLDESPTTYPAGTTYARFTAGFCSNSDPGDLRAALADQLHIESSADVLDRLDWLGLFSQDPLPVTATPTTPLDVLAGRMEQKLQYTPGQRDMIILRHGFITESPSKGREKITSRMVVYGEPNGETAMAKTVGLPAAIATMLVATGAVRLPGVHIPVDPQVYNPVLDELESLGIAWTEKREPFGP
ncbi:MAG: saccharopine dehydrogenase C-terminal domain-containing protein [Phycisphaerae bacterium]